MTCESPDMSQARTSLKDQATKYFQRKAHIYNERYQVRSAGDLLWVRHNATIETVRRWKLEPGSLLLDLGCGPGFMSRDFARMGYGGVGVDTSPAMIEYCEQQAAVLTLPHRWSYQLGDVEHVKLPDCSFNGVVCAGVIDYLQSDDNLISEASRLLKPGGRLLLCFTNRFGYTVSFSRPMYWAKRSQVLRSLASRLRSALVGGKQGAMEFSFLPRKHRPAQAREAVRRHGFRITGDRFVHFSLLPAPFCTLTSKLRLGIDEKLNALDSTPLRVFGSCYMLDCCIEK